MKPFWILRRDAATTHHIGTQRVTPVAQSVGLRWRGGGWLWQFPLAVHVEDMETGAEKRVSIPDTTRTLLWLLYALTVTITLKIIVIAFMQQRDRRSRKV